jgi:hypothetical protein
MRECIRAVVVACVPFCRPAQSMPEKASSAVPCNQCGDPVKQSIMGATHGMHVHAMVHTRWSSRTLYSWLQPPAHADARSLVCVHLAIVYNGHSGLTWQCLRPHAAAAVCSAGLHGSAAQHLCISKQADVKQFLLRSLLYVMACTEERRLGQAKLLLHQSLDHSVCWLAHMPVCKKPAAL